MVCLWFGWVFYRKCIMCLVCISGVCVWCGVGFMRGKMRILVGVDGSLPSRRALAEAVSLGLCCSGFVKVVSVYEKGDEARVETVLGDVRRFLGSSGVQFEVEGVVGSSAADALVVLAKRENFDLIVVGSRGLGRRVSLFLGSVSRRVVSNSYCNVLVVKK